MIINKSGHIKSQKRTMSIVLFYFCFFLKFKKPTETYKQCVLCHGCTLTLSRFWNGWYHWVFMLPLLIASLKHTFPGHSHDSESNSICHFQNYKINLEPTTPADGHPLNSHNTKLTLISNSFILFSIKPFYKRPFFISCGQNAAHECVSVSVAWEGLLQRLQHHLQLLFLASPQNESLVGQQVSLQQRK